LWLGVQLGRYANPPRFAYFPSLCIRPPAFVDAIPYREAVWAGESFKYDDEAGQWWCGSRCRAKIRWMGV
jgi:hypothetical protein